MPEGQTIQYERVAQNNREALILAFALEQAGYFGEFGKTLADVFGELDLYQPTYEWLVESQAVGEHAPPFSGPNWENFVAGYQSRLPQAVAPDPEDAPASDTPDGEE
jgi:hypothetical protein